jgi:hypothetical protein
MSVSGYCQTSPLVELVGFTDLWEIVCSFLDGDSLTDLASVRPFRTPTQSSPAFVLLAGLRDDAELVPWNDEANCLSEKYDGSHRLNWNREYEANQAAECMCQYVVYPHYLQRHHKNHPHPYIRSGPARPPSPAHRPDQPITHVDYEPYCHTWDSSMHLNPPVFGIRLSGFFYGPYWRALVYDRDDSDLID